MRSRAAASPTTDSSHNTSLSSSSEKQAEKIWYVASLGSMLFSNKSEKQDRGPGRMWRGGISPTISGVEETSGERYRPVSSQQLLSVLVFAQSVDCCKLALTVRRTQPRSIS